MGDVMLGGGFAIRPRDRDDQGFHTLQTLTRLDDKPFAEAAFNRGRQPHRQVNEYRRKNEQERRDANPGITRGHGGDEYYRKHPQKSGGNCQQSEPSRPYKFRGTTSRRKSKRSDDHEQRHR